MQETITGERQERSSQLWTLTDRAKPRQPFWKTIPRYRREYDTRDLLQALSAITSRDAEADSMAVAADPTTESLFPANRTAYFRSGRESLFTILKLLGLQPQARVGVPLYCCPRVFEAIAAARCTSVFLDIDLETYSYDLEFLRRNRTKLDALVLVHTFGYPANIGDIRACLGREIPIIEDCAHACFSECEGAPAGTLAEASFFSFGLHKPAAIGGGGAARFRDPALAAAAQRAPVAKAESRLKESAHALTCWARGITYQKSVYGTLLASPLGRARDPTCVHARLTTATREWRTADACFAVSRIRSCDRVLIADRLCSFRSALPVLYGNTQQIRNALRGTDLHIPVEPTRGTWNHFLLPVRFRSLQERGAVRRLLRRARIDTAPIYQNCASTARLFGYTGDCPNAERAAQTIAVVPHYASLTQPEIEYVAEWLRRIAVRHK